MVAVPIGMIGQQAQKIENFGKKICLFSIKWQHFFCNLEGVWPARSIAYALPKVQYLSKNYNLKTILFQKLLFCKSLYSWEAIALRFIPLSTSTTPLLAPAPLPPLMGKVTR